MPGRGARTVLLAGALAGALDISAAFVTWYPKGVMPATILRGIASALLGTRALHGGAGIAALGLALHFSIALGAATTFYAASRAMPGLVRRPWLWGPLYGVAVYVVMYWVVVPLSAYHRRPPTLQATVVAIVTHIFCVGLPIVWVTARRAPLRP